MKNISENIRVTRMEVYGNKSILFLWLSILLNCGYLLVLPPGIIGYLIPITSFFVLIFASNKRSFAVFCLLVGPLVFGSMLQSFGIPYLGSLLSIIIGVFFILKYVNVREIRKTLFSLFLWINFTLLTFVFSYINGPQSIYSQNKFIWFFIGLFLSIFASMLLFKDKEVNYLHCGLLSLSGGIVYYASILYTFPNITPNSIWIIAGLRMFTGSDSFLAETQMVSYVILTGMMFLICFVGDSRCSRLNKNLCFLSVFLGFIVLISCGQRLYILAPVLSSVFYLFCRPKNKKIIKNLNIMLFIGIILTIFIGIKNDVSYVTRVLENNVDFATRANRNENWEAAIRRINETTIWGCGLGGYYIEGLSSPGDGTYPHNILLELLCESGIFGTVIILFPLFLFTFLRKNDWFSLKTASGQSPLPWIFSIFIISLVSHDLQRSSYFLGASMSWLTYLKK